MSPAETRPKAFQVGQDIVPRRLLVHQYGDLCVLVEFAFLLLEEKRRHLGVAVGARQDRVFLVPLRLATTDGEDMQRTGPAASVPRRPENKPGRRSGPGLAETSCESWLAHFHRLPSCWTTTSSTEKISGITETGQLFGFL